MTKGFVFIPDQRGIYQVTTGPEIADLLNERAREAATEIRKRAPRRGKSFMGYRRKIKTTRARRVGNTIQAEVYVDSPVWHLPEYGTSEITPTAPIRNGVRATGIKFEE